MNKEPRQDQIIEVIADLAIPRTYEYLADVTRRYNLITVVKPLEDPNTKNKA